MAALTQDWAPGATPGARPFENDMGFAPMAGIDYALEQVSLLEQSAVFRPGRDHLYALAVTYLTDPAMPDSGSLLIPAMTLAPDGTQNPVLMPSVVEIDCSDWEQFDAEEPFWRRFPSLIGRALVYEPIMGEMLLEGLAYHRLWNCWPINAWDASMVLQGVAEWHRNEWQPYLKWLECRDNSDVEPCDIDVMDAAGMHAHQYDDEGYLSVGCAEGNSWFDNYYLSQIACNEVGDPFHVPFGPIPGLHHLAPVWDNLLRSSRLNTMAALHSYPHWERDQMALTERYTSPWLWSYSSPPVLPFA